MAATRLIFHPAEQALTPGSAARVLRAQRDVNAAVAAQARPALVAAGPDGGCNRLVRLLRRQAVSLQDDKRGSHVLPETMSGAVSRGRHLAAVAPPMSFKRMVKVFGVSQSPRSAETPREVAAVIGSPDFQIGKSR